MLKKLDNSLSLSLDELADEITKNLNEIDLNREFEKYINSIKEYLGDDKLYNDWVNYINQEIHSSIPSEEKNKCKACQGNIKLAVNKACSAYYLKAEDVFITPIIIYVGFIENNTQVFKSKELIAHLTQELFKNFKFNKGELSFNAKKFDKTLLTNGLLLLRDSFVELKTHKAINRINVAIEELETHKVIAKIEGRILFDFVKPQIKFLKKQLKYYENKLLTETLNDSSSSDVGKESLFKMNNNLIPELSVDQVYKFFKILTQTTNKKQEFYLSEEKLLVFIQSTFVDKKPIPQSFDVLFSRDKIDVRSVFRNFLIECLKFENNNKNLKQKYFDIMNKGFQGFNKIDFDKFHKTSSKIQTIKLHKSK